MTISKLYFENHGTIVYEGHAGFLVSTIERPEENPFALLSLCKSWGTLVSGVWGSGFRVILGSVSIECRHICPGSLYIYRLSKDGFPFYILPEVL